MKEIVLYTGKSPLEAPLILLDTETVPYQLILGQEHMSLKRQSQQILSDFVPLRKSGTDYLEKAFWFYYILLYYAACMFK